jgi:hypothetical protein
MRGDTDGREYVAAEYDGLTKREYFAAHALRGLLTEWPCTSSHKSIAEDAVKFADALIDALNKKP